MSYGFKLVRLEIEGFRTFQNKFELDLRSPSKEPINYLVIAGPNGCGKTTILDAIFLLFGGGGSSDIKANTRLSAEVEGLVSKALYRVERIEGLAERSNFSVEYLSAQRVSLSKQLRVLNPLLSHEWLGRLNAYWREFRDDGTHFVIDRCGEREWGLFVDKGAERLYSVEALSSGEQSVLALAVPLVHTWFEGLLLIDYPEQYLHPRWAGRVVRALRNLAPKAQVIVATHADDPWDDAKSWERRLLEERT